MVPLFFQQPIVVAPIELNSKREHHKKGSRKSRRTSSSTSSTKGESVSKHPQDSNTLYDKKSNGADIDEEFNNKEKTLQNSFFKAENLEDNDTPYQKGKSKLAIF